MAAFVVALLWIVGILLLSDGGLGWVVLGCYVILLAVGATLDQARKPR